MHKSTKTLLIIIGCLSIGAGLFSYWKNNDSSNLYSGIFIGVALVGGVLLVKPKEKNKS